MCSSSLLLAAVAGCHDPVTEVVVVMQSDLAIPSEADAMSLAIVEGPGAPITGGPNLSIGILPLPAFPLSVGFTSGGATASFSIKVDLLTGAGNPFGPSQIAVSRTVTDIRFVDEQTRMVVVPLLRVCKCDGTSCPNPGNPDCDNIQKPAVLPFDPEVAPPSTMMATAAGIIR